MKSEHIGFGEALSILIIVTLSHLILTLPKTIIENQGTASIINIIYVTILALIFMFIITKLYKNFNGQDILDISGFLFGNFFKFIIGIAFIVYFLFVASLLIRNTSENLKTMYFKNTPIPYLTFFILISASFINRLGSKTVIKSNLIIVSLISIVLSILFLLSTNTFKPERIYPIFGYGIKNTFIDGSSNIYIIGCISYIFFLMPLLKDYKQFGKISYFGIGISGLFILLTIIALILMFPFEIASTSNLPIYMQTREITFGNLIQRTDAFFVIVWILTLLSYLSIILNFIISIFKKITNIQYKSSLVNCFLAILFGISLLYSNIIQVKYLQATIYKDFSLILVIGICFLILVLANIKKAINSKPERSKK